jgi:hypothetical protein
MRKKVVAKTIYDLVPKLAKNEGMEPVNAYSLKRTELFELYDIKPDYERDQYVAIRKEK